MGQELGSQRNRGWLWKGHGNTLWFEKVVQDWYKLFHCKIDIDSNLVRQFGYWQTNQSLQWANLESNSSFNTQINSGSLAQYN